MARSTKRELEEKYGTELDGPYAITLVNKIRRADAYFVFESLIDGGESPLESWLNGQPRFVYESDDVLVTVLPHAVATIEPTDPPVEDADS